MDTYGVAIITEAADVLLDAARQSIMPLTQLLRDSWRPLVGQVAMLAGKFLQDHL